MTLKTLGVSTAMPYMALILPGQAMPFEFTVKGPVPVLHILHLPDISGPMMMAQGCKDVMTCVGLSPIPEFFKAGTHVKRNFYNR